MKLYDAGWAPSPRRVRMFLAEKGLDLAATGIERVIVDLAAGAQLAPDFLRINPRGTVPVLVLDDGTAIADSVAICRYFDALYPEPRLFGATPVDQAATEEWTRIAEHEGYAAVVYAFRNRARTMAGRALAGHWPEMPQIPELVTRGQAMWGCFIARLEAWLADRIWLATDAFGFADLSAFVALEFAVATRLSDGSFPPAIARWHAAIAARPSAAA